MEPLADALASYGLFHSARAELLYRLGHHTDARHAYQAALACPCNDAERRFLLAQLARDDP
jgi:RNA polymerase sigma-70 factor (ECF subfamily)